MVLTITRKLVLYFPREAGLKNTRKGEETDKEEGEKTTIIFLLLIILFCIKYLQMNKLDIFCK